MHRFILYLFVVLAGFSSCKIFSKARLGEMVGQKTGTAMGSVIGDAAGNEVAGTMIGGSLGAATGDALVKSTLEKEEEELKTGVKEAFVHKAGETLVVEFRSVVLFQQSRSVQLSGTRSAILDKMANIFNKYPESKISISASNITAREISLLVGEKQSTALKNYLNQKGIDASRITVMPATGKSKTSIVRIVLS